MTPWINGCKCSRCGEWHDMIKQLPDGKYVCVNCFYKEEEEEGEDGKE